MTSAVLSIVKLHGPTYSAMVARLGEAGLPINDLDEGNVRYFANKDGSAFGGLVVFGDAGFLRSIVVAPEKRGSGAGRALLAELVGWASVLGLRDLWLLTESAEGFFQRCGFARAERCTAPEPIAATRQFRELCPSTATLMRKRLL